MFYGVGGGEVMRDYFVVVAGVNGDLGSQSVGWVVSP